MFVGLLRSAHRKVIIHVPLQIKHLTRTVVKVVEKPVVKQFKHDGEIIHHHRHFGHVEHDHSHNIHGPKSPHEHEHEQQHQMDGENFAKRRTPPPPPPPPLPQVSSAGMTAKLWQPAASAIKQIVGITGKADRLAKNAAFYRASPSPSPSPSTATNYDSEKMLKSPQYRRQHRHHQHHQHHHRRQRHPSRNNRNFHLPPQRPSSSSYVRVLFHSMEQ
ncbi:protein tweety-like [Planococcus citri]|uniref:protein tweety-like n=1 Tax=Planococcus citri TaxID=170843 RepID=UPI0031F7A6DB